MFESVSNTPPYHPAGKAAMNFQIRSEVEKLYFQGRTSNKGIFICFLLYQCMWEVSKILYLFDYLIGLCSVICTEIDGLDKEMWLLASLYII